MPDHPPDEVYHSPIPDGLDILVHRLLYHFDELPIADDEPMGFFGINQSGWIHPEMMIDELQSQENGEMITS